MPVKYLYEPWKAPLSVQKEAGCIIGQDYPHPIVDHDVQRPANMARMKEAYRLNRLDSGACKTENSKKKHKH